MNLNGLQTQVLKKDALPSIFASNFLKIEPLKELPPTGEINQVVDDESDEIDFGTDYSTNSNMDVNSTKDKIIYQQYLEIKKLRQALEASKNLRKENEMLKSENEFLKRLLEEQDSAADTEINHPGPENVQNNNANFHENHLAKKIHKDECEEQTTPNSDEFKNHSSQNFQEDNENSIKIEEEPYLIDDEEIEESFEESEIVMEENDMEIHENPEIVMENDDMEIHENQNNINRRKKKKSSNQQYHRCDICNKTFKYACLLKNHYSCVHQNVKEFPCDFCTKEFSSFAKLKRHLSDVHYGIKNFKCNSCEKAFCQLGQLQAHVKSVHEVSRDHICEQCNKSFSLSSNLKAHIANVHEKLVTYVCEICYKTFNHSSSFKRHITKVHPQSNEPIIDSTDAEPVLV